VVEIRFKSDLMVRMMMNSGLKLCGREIRGWKEIERCRNGGVSL
jgi:hypothetical protein